ncbi:MAG TPA: TraR/DksA C4-type zinc finger protein [Candidatus Dormibacteraeota bacterium]|jgi:RNA polymerase-binding transcription factor DksA|nr:TraR/DksA C4-type zinc finger protein [Candidatus Dormibacteraeota bacterium]
MDTDTARTRLEEERRRLEETRRAAQDLVSGNSEEAVQELASYDQHQADQGTETFERERDVSVLQRVEAQLREVEAALERLEAGTYGLCELCGKPIGDERLEAMPAARYCLEDQAIAERDGRLRSGAPAGDPTY